MKRLLSLTLALIITLALAGCNAPAAETVTDGTEAVTAVNADVDVATNAATAAVADDEAAEAVTLTESKINSNIDINFAQDGDTTVVTLTSPFVSQFAEANINYAEVDNPAIFTVQFESSEGWKQGFSFDFGYNFVGTDENDKMIFEPHGGFSDHDNIQVFNYYDDMLIFKIDGDTAKWSITGVDISLNNITDVMFYSELDNRNPDDKLFFEVLPIEQVAVSDTLPVPASSETSAAVPLGGTIDMPDGFPSNPGDAENFKPLTDDYIYHVANSNLELYGLVSYDTSGNIVQFVMKRIYDSDSEADPSGYMDEHTAGDHSPYITKVGNVLYVDCLAMDGNYSSDGYETRDDGTKYPSRPYWYGFPISRAMYDSDKTEYSDNEYYAAKP
jgi:hypothetical protein